MCQMQVTFPVVEFLRTLSRFKKRKENSSLCVHVLQKTNHMHGFHLKVIDQWMSKKCTKKCDSAVFFFSHKTKCFLKLLLGHHSCLSSLMINPLEISRSVIGMVVIF